MSDIESSAPPSVDAGAFLGKLLSNPDLIRNLSSMLGKSKEGATEAEQQTPQGEPNHLSLENSQVMIEGISRVLSNPEMMAKLPDMMKMLAPMVQQAQSSQAGIVSSSHTTTNEKVPDRHSCRNDLLLALKPFLSPERCRAIDMLLGLSRLGAVLQKMI